MANNAHVIVCVLAWILGHCQDCGKSRSQLGDDLLEATRQKDPLQVKLLLAVNADARSTVEKMTVETAGQVHAGLLKASGRCHVEAVKVMLAMGGENVDVNARDLIGKTALHRAVASRCPQVVRLLLDAKADVNAKDKDGNTPAMVLSYKQKSDPRHPRQPGPDIWWEDMWYQLKAAGALVPDRPYESPAVLNEKLLDTAANENTFHYTFLATVKGLLASGADANTRDQGSKKRGRMSMWSRCVDFTPLHWAAATGNAAVVKELLVAGAKVNLVAKGDTSMSGTPLQVAATKGHQDVVKLLLAAGAKVNLVAKGHPSMSGTPLQVAATKGHQDVVKLLLAAGADVNPKYTGSKATPLRWAVGKGRTDIVKLLLDAGARVSSADIATAKRYNHAELVRLLTSTRSKQKGKSPASPVSPGLP